MHPVPILPDPFAIDALARVTHTVATATSPTIALATADVASVLAALWQTHARLILIRAAR
ncbi:MAG TPA: hypothetical protein VEL73_07455 [Mycobacteriales bacterium]|nr:hypothetical protein [Mycobacteriales bacterium]